MEGTTATQAHACGRHPGGPELRALGAISVSSGGFIALGDVGLHIITAPCSPLRVRRRRRPGPLHRSGDGSALVPSAGRETEAVDQGLARAASALSTRPPMPMLNPQKLLVPSPLQAERMGTNPPESTSTPNPLVNSHPLGGWAAGDVPGFHGQKPGSRLKQTQETRQLSDWCCPRSQESKVTRTPFVGHLNSPVAPCWS